MGAGETLRPSIPVEANMLEGVLVSIADDELIVVPPDRETFTQIVNSVKVVGKHFKASYRVIIIPQPGEKTYAVDQSLLAVPSEM